MFTKWFAPKVQFFDLFEKHIALSLQAAKIFLVLVTKQDLKSLSERIKNLEHQGDEITRQVSASLHKTFITPIDRDQMYQLINRLDDILDSIDAAADAIETFKITTVTIELKDLIHVVVQAIEQLQIAIGGLRQLKNNRSIHIACELVNHLEHEADTIFRNALGKLFETEKDAKQIIIWKDLYENLEEASDRCADVADVIEGILLEND